MQNTTETAMNAARSGIDGAMRLGAQTAELLRTCAHLQTEGASQVLDESIRISKVVMGDTDSRNAIAQWGKMCEQAYKGYFESTRSLQESALLSHAEMVRAAGNLLVASNKLLIENLEKVAREVKEEGAKSPPQPVSHKRAA